MDEIEFLKNTPILNTVLHLLVNLLEF